MLLHPYRRCFGSLLSACRFYNIIWTESEVLVNCQINDTNVSKPLTKVEIAKKIATYIAKSTSLPPGKDVAEEIPRWKILIKNIPDRRLDCDKKAALCAAFLGIIGIESHVQRVYATCSPVPPHFSGFNQYEVNDYVSNYPKTENRFKSREFLQKVNLLRFRENNFEGCLRVPDESSDQNYWITLVPKNYFETAKDLIIWYNDKYDQRWIGFDLFNKPILIEPNITLPENELKQNPDIID